VKKLTRIALAVIVTATVGCTSSTIVLKIEDQNGDSHYYGRKPIDSVEMWCFIHDQYEQVKIK